MPPRTMGSDEATCSRHTYLPTHINTQDFQAHVEDLNFTVNESEPDEEEEKQNGNGQGSLLREHFVTEQQQVDTSQQPEEQQDIYIINKGGDMTINTKQNILISCSSQSRLGPQEQRPSNVIFSSQSECVGLEERKETDLCLQPIPLTSTQEQFTEHSHHGIYTEQY